METAVWTSRPVYPTYSRIQYDDYINLSDRYTHGRPAIAAHWDMAPSNGWSINRKCVLSTCQTAANYGECWLLRQRENRIKPTKQWLEFGMSWQWRERWGAELKIIDDDIERNGCDMWKDDILRRILSPMMGMFRWTHGKLYVNRHPMEWVVCLFICVVVVTLSENVY